MNYLSKTNRRESLTRKIVLFSGVILILWFLGGFVINIFSPGAFFILRPIFVVTSKVSNSLLFYFSFLKPKAQLIEENNLLKEQAKNFAIWQLEYKILKDENESLKGIKSHASSTSIVAAVLKTPGSSPYDTLLIDRGSIDGVAEGMEVYTSSIVPIGLIDRVYGKTSLVRLFSSPGDSHDVYIGAGKIAGNAVGRGGGNFEIILPRSNEVEIGDSIVFPSIGSKILGVVEIIEETEGGTFERIFFKNPFSFDELRFVEIVKE
ncbi:MAG: rod shape-determining protein MreC [Patescibacteria group bacterium]